MTSIPPQPDPADRDPSEVRLSIIIATTGRETLGSALASATSQMLPGDELVVVFDGSGDAGDTPRNRVLGSVTGTHITFLDDDDEYRPGALDAIRRFARQQPGRIGIFRISRGLYGLAWRETGKNLIYTATAMYVVPNVRGKVGRFGRAPGAPTGRLGDFPFIVDCVAFQGEPVWCEDIIQDINPEKRRLRRLRYRIRPFTRVKRAFRMKEPTPVGAVRGYPEAERWAQERILELRSLNKYIEP